MSLHGGRGGTRGEVEGTHCLWRPTLPGNPLQVYGASYCVRGRLLAIRGAQPQARQIEVSAADSYIDQGGSRCPYIGTYLLGGGAIGLTIWFRDMGPDAAYEEGVGRIPP